MPRGNPGRLKRDLTGQRFGRLKVLAFAGRWGKSPAPYWRCLCDCGQQTFCTTWNLLRPTPPHSRSCGCLRRELARSRQLAAASLLRAVLTRDKDDR